MAEDHELAALGIRRIAIDTDPDELVLPEESGQRLGWIAGWLSQPPFIFREWGLSRFVDGGLRALFVGASGTGKTMAAVALAKSAGFDLYRVDMSAVAGKYAGETEKNLSALFAMADEERAILMFDEAADVDGLLRRIEPFDGLAILAAHQAGGVGQGALGRIDVLVDFPMPDPAARAAIWGKLLAAVKLHKSDKLDLALLARHQLSGAEILRSVRMASLLAAGEERALDFEHLQAAAAERIAMRRE